MSSNTPILNTDANVYATRFLDDISLQQSIQTQISYYLSTKNLSKDTYLSTILSLNSNYLPITILGNFANVNRIIEQYAPAINSKEDESDKIDFNALDVDQKMHIVHKVLEGVSSKSNLLELVVLDQGGNVVCKNQTTENVPVDEEFESKKAMPLSFLAVGLNKFGRSVENTTTSPVSEIVEEKKENEVVILRDVSNNATEEDIRKVFSSDDENLSLTIIKIEKDEGNSWSITIDSSTSRQDLVSILLTLRNKTICNEPVKARLRTQSSATAQTNSTPRYYNNTYSSQRNINGSNVYAGDRVTYSRKFNKQYSKQRGGKNSNEKQQSKKSKPIEKPTVPPPPLVEEHFPGLGGDGNVAPKKDVTGSAYAAALLKAAPPVTEVSTGASVARTGKKANSSPRKKVDDTKSTGTISTEGSSADDKSHASKEMETVSPPVKASWGGGKSFADILKKQETA